MVRDLSERVVDRAIAHVDAPFEGSIVWPVYSEFRRRAVGRTIRDVARHGKFAAFKLDSDDLLIVHRGMSGSLLHRMPDDPMESHVRVALTLNDGSQLRFNDPRKFGKLYIMAQSGGERPLPWAHMGPEPFDAAFSPASLQRSLRGRTAMIKPLLLGQRLVVGLGNIYVDEALHMARIHPERRANTLRPAEIRRLHAAIREVLSAAVGGRGTTFNSYMDLDGNSGGYGESLRVFGRTGSACERCGTPVVKFVVGGRGTHICPRCQRS
jgi:formamidopyrimidine-DNA glycosylase